MYLQTDIVAGHGTEGSSIFGETFVDECFTLSHNATGIISMANQGPHTNASQFFVTLKPLPCFDKSFVAFGRVVSGMRHLRAIQNLPLANQRPTVTCHISGGGLLCEAVRSEGKGSEKEDS